MAAHGVAVREMSARRKKVYSAKGVIQRHLYLSSRVSPNPFFCRTRHQTPTAARFSHSR